MQTASSNFTRAVTGSSGVWAPPQVLADWAGDGYDQIKTPDILDSFSRTHTAGFGRADSGQLWVPVDVPAADYAVVGGAATITLSDNLPRCIGIGGMVTDFDVRYRMSTNQLAVGQALRASVAARVLDFINFYFLSLDFNIDQVIGYGLRKNVAGTQTTFASGLVAGITHAVDRKFWIRAQGKQSGAGSTTFRLKIWQDGTDQPTAWNATAVDSEPALAGPGLVGVRASAVSGNTNTRPVFAVDRFSNGAWDDLTHQSGAISISQALDDGLPGDITYTSGTDSTSSATVAVGDRGRLSAAQYWSQDTAASPIAAYERDVPSMQIAVGPVTAGGPERVTVFTGQMSDAPVQGVTAMVDAVSKTRLALTKSIQPPPVWGTVEGLNATWPVSWALAQCGVYTSPPPRAGCVWWAPMHGSMHPFLSNSPLNDDVGNMVKATTTGSGLVRPTFVPGPFVLGLFADAKADHAFTGSWGVIRPKYGTQLFAQQGNAGRLEFWVRADPITIASVGDPYLTYLVLGPAIGGTPNLAAGVDKSFRPFIQVADGSHTTTYTGSAFTQDGQWHFVGIAWDIAANKLWLAADGTVQSTTPSPAMTTANLPAVIDSSVYSTAMLTNWPLAEVQLTSGVQANPDNYVWINSGSYPAASAVIRPSILDLVAVVESAPTDAASYIAKFAQAELAATRTDEQDRFWYLPMPYWAESAQQTVADALSTSSNVGQDWSVSRDLTKIRNQVALTYTDARISNDLTSALQDLVLSFTVYTLPRGVTTITLPLTYPTVNIGFAGGQILLLDAAGTNDEPGQSLICANTAPDGTGSFNTDNSQIDARVTFWDPGKATITVRNNTGTTYYTANSGVVPYIRLCGTYVSTDDGTLTVQDDASIAKRGIRGLSAGLPAIQDVRGATLIAQELLTRSKTALKQLSLTARGDPRRQPGDLTRFADPNNTNANSLWRVLTVGHGTDGANYTQAVTAVEALLVGVWDQTTWDNCIWGP